MTKHLLLLLSVAPFVQAAPALLEPLEGYSFGKLEEGAFLYADRNYQMYAPPAAIRGMNFLCAEIDGKVTINVQREGSLTVLTPYEGSPYSQAAILKQNGFTLREDIPPFQPHSSNACDVTRVWQKIVQKGESLTLGKWAIIAGFDVSNQSWKLSENVQRIVDSLKGTPYANYANDIAINRPDYLVFIPKQPMDVAKRDISKPGDTYNDHFQVIYKPQNQMLFAFWTQASKEADPDQHIAFAKSADKGKTWTDPVILAGSHNKKNPGLLASWQQPMISKSGRIYCLWNQQTTSAGPHCGQMFGAYSDDDGETWTPPKMVPMTVRMDNDPADPLIPPSWCNWQRPLRLGKDGRYFVGVSRHGKAPYDEKFGCKIDFLQYDNIDDDPPVEKIHLSHFSTNRAALTAPKLNDYEPAAEEAAIVKLPDGRLFAMMRSSCGSPLWSQSRDGGVTWEPTKQLKDRHGNPYKHPRSPCPLYDWKGCEAASGMYFALVHNTFDPSLPNAYQPRGPLYLIAGHFDPDAEQPIQFAEPKLFAPRKGGNSFYTSYTIIDGKGILWFPDKKFYLLGREIDESWFK